MHHFFARWLSLDSGFCYLCGRPECWRINPLWDRSAMSQWWRLVYMYIYQHPLSLDSITLRHWQLGLPRGIKLWRQGSKWLYNHHFWAVHPPRHPSQPHQCFLHFSNKPLASEPSSQDLHKATQMKRKGRIQGTEKVESKPSKQIKTQQIQTSIMQW